MNVTLWGTRGSLPNAGPETVRFALNNDADNGCNKPRSGGWLRHISARCGGSELQNGRRQYTTVVSYQSGWAGAESSLSANVHWESTGTIGQAEGAWGGKGISRGGRLRRGNSRP